MRPLTPTLEAAQRSPSVQPYLRVQLHDRDVGSLRLRWRRVYSGPEPDGPCAAAVAGDGALLRSRIDPSTGALTRQRVASPGPVSDYGSWTPVATVAAGPRVGLAARGTRAMIASVRTDGVTVDVRESTDGGATFGAASAVAVASGVVTAVACSMAPDGTAAVIYAVGGVVYAVRRFRTGRWLGPAAWSRSLATVNALAASFEVDHNVLISGTNAAGDAGVWSTIYGAGGAYPPGRWRPLAEVVSAAPGTRTTYLASGTANADAPRNVFVESYAGGGAYDRVHIGAGVGGTAYRDQLWRNPRPFGHESPHGLAIASGRGGAWLASPSAVWHAPYPEPAADLGADVLEATLIEGLRGGRMRLVLRNDDGRYGPDAAPVALAAGGELRPGPGYVTSAGEESSDGRAFWIAAVRRRYEPGGSTVEIEAVDGWGLLDAWTAPRQFVWAAGEASASRVLTGVMQHAGVRLASGSSSVESATLRPAFTMRAGERGSTAVRRLLAMLPDEGDHARSLGVPGRTSRERRARGQFRRRRPPRPHHRGVRRPRHGMGSHLWRGRAGRGGPRRRACRRWRHSHRRRREHRRAGARRGPRGRSAAPLAAGSRARGGGRAAAPGPRGRRRGRDRLGARGTPRGAVPRVRAAPSLRARRAGARSTSSASRSATCRRPR